MEERMIVIRREASGKLYAQLAFTSENELLHDHMGDPVVVDSVRFPAKYRILGPKATLEGICRRIQNSNLGDLL